MLLAVFRNLKTLNYCQDVKLLGFQVQRKLYSSDTKDSTGIFVPSYSSKPNETDGEKKARLLYQSRKRGMLENDLLLSTFVDKYLVNMNKELLLQYDKLINSSYSDWDIYYWLVGKNPIPPEFDNEIMKLLIEHAKNTNKERRLRQPDLPNHQFDK